MAAPNPFHQLIINFGPGERIFTEGEVGTTMFIVQSGRIRLFREYDGQPVEIAEMEKGDFFGEMSLLEGAPRTLSAEAIEPVELIEINSTTFDRMIRANIEIAVRLLRKLSARLQKAEGRLAARLVTPAAPVEIPHPAPSLMEPVPASVFGAGPASPAWAVSVQHSAGPADPRTTAAGVFPKMPVRAAPAGPEAAGTGEALPSPPAPPRAGSGVAVPGSLSVRPTTHPGGGLRSARARGLAREGPRLMADPGDAVFPIAAEEALLGRYDPVTETQPEVDLTLIDIKRSVSRRHAKLLLREGSYYLTEEVGALNGTFVNGVKLVTGRPAPLKSGDRISLGTVNLVFKI